MYIQPRISVDKDKSVFSESDTQNEFMKQKQKLKLF